MGRPIITTNVPGCKETIIDGVSGLLCKEKNTKDAFDKIIKFIELNYSERNKKNLAFLILKFLNSKTEVILNGIDINKFQRKKNILDRKKIIIGMAGRFVNEKKQSLLIDAIIKYKKNFSDNYIEVSFAGSGYLLNNIKRKVRENNLSKFVKFKSLPLFVTE